MSADAVQEKFGNWLEPAAPGLFGLNMGALAVSAGGLILTLISIVRGAFLLASVVAIVVVLLVVLGLVRFGGTTISTKAFERVSLARRRARGETFYVTGALSTLPAADVERLPGALVNVDTLSGEDGLGRPYSLLHHSKAGQIAAVFGCSPDGSAMEEQSVVNTQVAHFGAWIASLSDEKALSGATVVVDSASESSAGACAAIRDSVVSTAPDFAKAVVDDATDTLPARTSTVNVYTSLVWDADALGADGSDLTPAVAEIASRLPGQSELLAAAGAGDARPLVESELSQIARLSYQPGRDQEMGLDALGGLASTQDWAHAGPDFFDDSHGRVVYHDGVASMTAMMTIPPGSHITAKSFDSIFGPNPKFLRKRVAVLYRPVDPGGAAKKVDRLVKTADWTMSTRKGRATSFDKHRKAVAEKAEEELSTGARLSMFSLMVTVTFAADDRSYREAAGEVKSMLDRVLMPYRFVEHAGSAAFHVTLPFGVLPWKYTAKPVWMEGVV